MSVTSAEGANSPMEANAPLGVGSIVSDSFSILFKNIIKVMLLGFVPMMIGLVASGVLVSWEFALSGGEAIGVAPSITGIIVSVLLQMAIYGVIVALLIQLAYDAKQGRSHSLLAYFGPALKSAFPIAILALVSGVLVGIAAIALIIPGISSTQCFRSWHLRL